MRNPTLTEQVFYATDGNDRMVDAVRRFEAAHEVLKREALDMRREGELLGLTRALALVQSVSPDEARKRLKAAINLLAWGSE